MRRRRKEEGGREGGRGGEDYPPSPHQRASPLRLLLRQTTVSTSPRVEGPTCDVAQEKEDGRREAIRGKQHNTNSSQPSTARSPGEFGRMTQKTCRSASKPAANARQSSQSHLLAFQAPFPKAGSGAQKVVKGGRRRSEEEAIAVYGL